MHSTDLRYTLTDICIAVLLLGRLSWAGSPPTLLFLFFDPCGSLFPSATALCALCPGTPGSPSAVHWKRMTPLFEQLSLALLPKQSTRALIISFGLAWFLGYSKHILICFQVTWKPRISSFKWGMVACSPPGNDWVPSQNVEATWFTPAQLWQKQ